MLGVSANLTQIVFVFVYLYLHVRQMEALFSRSSYHYLFKNIAYVRCIWNFDQSCIFLLMYLCICIFVYLCICVFAHQILMNIFLRSSYHNLFKNIAYVMPMFNFNQSCICVIVYLCIFIWLTRKWWWVSW